MPKVQGKLRMSHLKSRLGCSTCKQRHQKCDETRPSCLNCVKTHRHCGYLDDPASQKHRTPSSQISTSPKYSRSDHLKDNRISQSPIQLVSLKNLADHTRIELLQYWLSDTYRTCVGPKDYADGFVVVVLDLALNTPFLLKSVLAISALHKAILKPSLEQERYLTISDTLRSEGLSQFNSLVPQIDKETVVPAFLFAFITGIHQLCHASTQTRRKSEFLDSLVDAMTFLRGVSVIISGWWPYIQQSELSSLIPNTDASNNANRRSHDAEITSRLRKLVDEYESDAEVIDTYNAVIDGLQTAYGDLDILSASSDSETSIGFVVVWMIKAPAAFVQYVKERQPLALVILAHTAPLFHYRRDHWGVGDAGTVLIDAISSHLQASWQSWLEWPKDIMNLA